MSKKMRIAASIAALACMTSVFAGCDVKKEATTAGEGADKITYWTPLGSNTSQVTTDLGETPFGKELMKRTGIEIEFQHPAQGQAGEKFNVMLAAGNLPDIIEYNWVNGYPGGPAKALEEGIIQEIDLKNEAPNLYAYIQEHPELDKFIKTDDGKYYGFPFIRGDEYLLTSSGPIVRQDWLDELGMKVPETIDEWTAMLRAFKEKKGAKVPLTINMSQIISWGPFVGAFDTFAGLYTRDGKVVYGPMEDSFKDFLIQMNKWFEEGLLDPDFVSVDTATVQSNMLNGVSGATYGSCGSGIGKWIAAATDEKYNLTGAKYPVLNKGDKPEFGSYEYPVTGSRVAVITKDAKDKELCLKLLDYAYSEEGSLLYNFGVEGESYTMVDGYPTYTEEITANPDGLSMTVALSKYALSQGAGAFLQDRRYMEQYANLPQQKSALENWTDMNMKNHLMPPVNYTDEQQQEVVTIKNDVSTYTSEWMAKFIMGTEPIDKFEEFKKGLVKRGVEKYIEYSQDGYDRFMNR